MASYSKIFLATTPRARFAAPLNQRGLCLFDAGFFLALPPLACPRFFFPCAPIPFCALDCLAALAFLLIS